MHEPNGAAMLVVDDEEALRKAIAFDFKRKGFVVHEAGSGAEAFAIVQNQKIDIILTDVRMPNGDGVSLLDNVKAIHPELPIVMFITGFADITMEDAYDKGVDAVFTKPFDRKALLAAVLRALSDKDVLWGAKRAERFDTDFQIDLRFPDLNFAIQGKVINVGRGGIFVALDGRFPTVDAQTDFCIRLNLGKPEAIEGHGIVRWVRQHSSDQRPTGCGIEFQHLTDQHRKDIIEFINQLKTKSFIPKG